MAEGWISIHRKIQQCEIWVSPQPFDYRSAWIDLLLLANHKDKQTVFDGSLITVKKGQRITSIRQLADRWHWSRTKVSKYLDILEQAEMIEQNRDRKKTVISIVNYSVYQDMQATEKPLKSHRSATEKPLKSLNNNDNNDNNDNKENIRHRHGEYKNVLLTDGEMETLRKEIPDLDQLIEELSSYMASSGKSYKSHLATLRNWARRRTKEPKKDKEQKAVSKFGSFQNDNRNDLDALARRLTAN